ncbi:MAG: hypothetical protein J6B71_03835 [Clostridia bacterium]|nr:hypothetical protein [Clostridia bacterium]
MKRVRVLAFLITVCMATTCLLGGTIARYQTSASIDDAATAARWGVTLTAEGSLFGKKYANGYNAPIVSDDENAFSVLASSTMNVVAPGTKGNTIKITLTGTPEVDVNVAFDKFDIEDIFLGVKNQTIIYAVMKEVAVSDTNFDAKKESLYTSTDGQNYVKVGVSDTYQSTNHYYIVHDTVELTDRYNPILYKTNYNSDTSYETLDALKTDLQTAFAGTNSNNYNAGYDLALLLGNSGVLNLTWEWAFNESNATYSAADTILGQLAAGVQVVKSTDAGVTFGATNAGTDYHTQAKFDITITVEQID